jgi:hypothetical protein
MKRTYEECLPNKERTSYSNVEDDIFNILTHNRMITAFSVSIVMAVFTLCVCSFMAMSERGKEKECFANITSDFQVKQSSNGRNRNGK